MLPGAICVGLCAKGGFFSAEKQRSLCLHLALQCILRMMMNHGHGIFAVPHFIETYRNPCESAFLCRAAALVFTNIESALVSVLVI